MRVSREKAQENRERIVASAARLFSERGFDGVGVDAIMEDAGLTHGGFYRHFKSKEALAVEALARALSGTLEFQKSIGDLETYVSEYLSAERRDDLSLGCAITAMGPDAARKSDLRRPISENVRGQIDKIGTLLAETDPAGKRARSIEILATMVGALVLSRAVDDPELSDEILDIARTGLGAHGKGKP